MAEERFARPDGDFLEEDDVGKRGTTEDVVEDEDGALVGPTLRGLHVPRREGQRLPAGGVGDCWTRRGHRDGWGVPVAEGDGCPSIAGAVKDRERTGNLIMEEHGRWNAMGEEQESVLCAYPSSCTTGLHYHSVRF